MSTPEEIATAYEASDPATQQLISALVDAQAAAEPPAEWPLGSGTEEDPYVAPPGWSPDWTEEDMKAAIEGSAG